MEGQLDLLTPKKYSLESACKAFKTEKENVLFYGISAKRYVLYDYDDSITVRKHSAHGLGHLIGIDEKQWWHDILAEHYAMKWNDSKYSSKFAVSQLTINNYDFYKRFEK